jgi:hypothetical protein
MPRQAFPHGAVGLPDQSGQRLKTAFLVDHPPQFLMLSRERFLRGVQVRLLSVPPVKIPIQPEAVSREVEGFALPAQVNHAGFLPVDFQPQPTFAVFSPNPSCSAARAALSNPCLLVRTGFK